MFGGKQSPEERLKHDENKLSAAREFKKEGNECFKLKDIKGAIRKYHQAILYLKAIGVATTAHSGDFAGLMEQKINLPKESMKEANKLGIDCFSNLAACMLTQQSPNYEKILQHCDNSLKLGETTKAFYRKGVALYHTNDIDGAFRCLKTAARDESGKKDPNIRKYIAMCEVALVQQDDKLKETYKGMFNKPPDTKSDDVANGIKE